MKVEFANNRLRRRYQSFADASRAWGNVIARRYIQRVDEIIAAENLNDLYHVPWYRLHRLSGQRAGQLSMALDRRWRLIFIYIQAENTVRIEEVTNHYGD